MLLFHRTVVDGSRGMVPFICDLCRRQATAVVQLVPTGYAPWVRRASARHAQRPPQALPEAASLARCPHCGQRSPASVSEARTRGRLLCGAGVGAFGVGVAVSLSVGGSLGLVTGGSVVMFGTILAVLALLSHTMAMAAADRTVSFEIAPASAGRARLRRVRRTCPSLRVSTPS